VNFEILLPVTFIQYVISFLFICCLPGLPLSYLFFPSSRLDYIERGMVMCFSSIAISSLLAGGLIIYLGQVTPMKFFACLVILTAGFTAAALWRVRPIKNDKNSFSLSIFPIRYQFNKPLLLVAAFLILIPFLLRLNPLWEFNFLDDHDGPVLSGVTEFFISPENIEEVLGSISEPQIPIEVPINIDNQNPDQKEFRIELVIDGQKIYVQSDIEVAAWGTWHDSVTIPESFLIHSDHIDIFLFDKSIEEPISQLRLWQ